MIRRCLLDLSIILFTLVVLGLSTSAQAVSFQPSSTTYKRWCNQKDLPLSRKDNTSYCQNYNPPPSSLCEYTAKSGINTYGFYWVQRGFNGSGSCVENDSTFEYGITFVECPVNSSLSAGSCAPNSGYSAVNTGTQEQPTWEVKPAGQECTAPKVYNASTGSCEDPAPSCESGDTKILNMPTGERDSPVSISSYDCINSCEYKIDAAAGVNECFSLPDSTNPNMVYCSLTYKATGSTCTQSIVSWGGSTDPKTPQSTTPIQNEIIKNPPTGSPTNGTSPNTSSGPASNPNQSGGGSGPSATSSEPPLQPTDQAAPPVVVAAGCDGCATESTQREVHKALTDSSGLPSTATDPTDDRNAINVEKLMVNNSTVQALFHYQVPAHTSTCPTAVIDIPYFQDEPYTLDSHCNLIQPHENTLKLLSTIAWIIMAALIILGA